MNRKQSIGTFLSRCFFLLFLMMYCTGCAARGDKVMTLEKFRKAHIGMSEQNLVREYGEPFKIVHEENVTIYEYVERFTMGDRADHVVEARRYYFYIREGKVISKQLVIQNQPSYEPIEDL